MPKDRELIFLKLGGSLITDKRTPKVARQEVIHCAAQEVQRALAKKKSLSLVLGHGSGSFGHIPALKYGTREGATSPEAWRGYAETSSAASRLNQLVRDIFLEEGVGVVSCQPSASALCRGGKLIHLEMRPLHHLLAHDLIPIVYGDVAIDELWGSTIISTEEIFRYLARRLSPKCIVLAGQVGGVYTADPLLDESACLIGEISPRNFAQVERLLAGSHGIDVTGGMLSKVRSMYELVCEQPSLTVRVISGMRAGLIERVLLEDIGEGTLIHGASEDLSTERK